MRPRSAIRGNRRFNVAAVGVVAVALTTMGVAQGAAAAPTVETVVSLTFDDGTADQRLAAPVLAEHGMTGTFFVSSGFVGAPGYLDRTDLDLLAKAGNEIGGHTVRHTDLGTLPADEMRRQICNDRSTLLSWGFAVTSLAYPFAVSTPEVETIAEECGYNSARSLGDIRSRFGCDGCPYASSIPPAKPYKTAAPAMVDHTWTLDDLKSSVINAENASGAQLTDDRWLQLTFHDICIVACSESAIHLSLFTEFLDWLQPRAATHNTVVKTVGDVIGGEVVPGIREAFPAASAPGENGVINPDLEEAGGTGVPYCWTPAGWGEHDAEYTTSTGRTDTTAQTITMKRHLSGDAKLIPQQDMGQCAPTVQPGHQYLLQAWYRSTVVTQFSVYLRDADGAWDYWRSSAWYEPSEEWTPATWFLPEIPEDATGISFGLSIFDEGVLTTDDYRLYDITAVAPSGGGRE